MTASQVWLPTTALFDGALTDAVSASLEHWRQKWFARPGRLSIRLQAGVRKQQHPMEGWRSSCGGLTTCADRERTHRFGAMLLAFRRTPRRVTSADTKLLKSLAADASKDLLATMASRFAVSTSLEPLTAAPTSAGKLPLLCFSVAGTYGRLFDLVATHDAAASARKSLVRPQREPAPLTNRTAAHEAMEVRVSARVGARRISASDLRSLTVNDVLVLDAQLTETPRLVMNGRVMTDPRMSLARNGASLVICTNEDRVT